jgi:hypothetical protein
LNYNNYRIAPLHSAFSWKKNFKKISKKIKKKIQKKNSKKIQKKFQNFLLSNFFPAFYCILRFYIQFGICLRKIGGSRQAGLAVKGIRTNKGLAKLLYRFVNPILRFFQTKWDQVKGKQEKSFDDIFDEKPQISIVL